ncbi:MAG: hypothetical protein ABIS36_09535 [Chryseolinea sp.]
MNSIVVVSLLIFAILTGSLFLFLPELVLKYVNRKFGSINGYQIHVGKIRMSVFHASFFVNEIEIRSDQHDQTPLLHISAPWVGISFKWRSLMHKKFIGVIRINYPSLLFKSSTGQHLFKNTTYDSIKLRTLLENIMSFQVDVQIVNGQLDYSNIKSTSGISAVVSNVTVNVSDLNNADPSLGLMTKLTGAADVFDGRIAFQSILRPMEEKLNLDAKLMMKNVNLAAVNGIFTGYSDFIFQQGNLALYVDIAINDSILKGYIKPVFKEIKITADGIKKTGVFRKIEKVMLNLILRALEDAKHHEVVTIIPISGTFDKPHLDIATALANLLKHAFIKPIQSTFAGRVLAHETIKPLKLSTP